MNHKVHEIKLLEDYCDAVLSSEKPFEVRKNDRGYQKGDHISFIPVNREYEIFYHPVSEKEYEITYVHSGLGLENGYVVLGIKDISGVTVAENTPIEAVGFSNRCWRMLKRNNINTTGDLDKYTLDGLMSLKNVGKATAHAIEKEYTEYKRRINNV